MIRRAGQVARCLRVSRPCPLPSVALSHRLVQPASVAARSCQRPAAQVPVRFLSHNSFSPSWVAVPRRAFASSGPGPASSEPGVIDFKLADIGEGIAEVELLEWFVEVGQPVAQFDRLCQVQSDKASVEITSRYDGVVAELGYQVGDMAKVGSTLIRLRATGESAAELAAASAAASPAAAAATPAASPVAAAINATNSSGEAVSASGKVLTSPAVRRIAKERGINLSLVPGTGPGGRILKSDVLNFDPAASSAAAAAFPAAAAQAAAAPPAAAKAAPLPISYPKAPAGQDTVHKVTGLQRVMVQTMTAAAAVPTFLYQDEIRVDNLVHARAQGKRMLESRAKARGTASVKLTYMPFFMKAMSLALRDYPQLNALVNSDCSEVVHKASHNIGLAMDTPRGLLVPNVKDCQSRSVWEIAAELNRLQALGAEGKLGAEDLQGGTVTLSNIGAIGGTYASPILVVPQVVIGALGRFQTVPRFDEEMKIARFSNQWKDYLENPYNMVIDL